jgi:glutamate-1-semialdehyde 2,1-aminomutase
MEVQRNEKPVKNFLQEIRKITSDNNIILIFDECTSGFRETLGGLHLKYKVIPDICVFGKAIANGIPLTAIIGKKDIMSSARLSFISSTFWTDRVGFSAALATLKEMERIQSWKIITRLGKKIKSFWFKTSKKYNLPIRIHGLDALPSFDFISNKNNYYKAYLTQEMLKSNVLATNTVYCSVTHKKYISKYFSLYEKIFSKIKKIENEGTILKFLEYPIADQGFQRLN